MHLALGYPVLLFFFLKPFVNLQRAVLGLFLIYIQVGSIPGDIQKKKLGTTPMECIYTPQFHRRLGFFLVKLLQILCESQFSERSGSLLKIE
jgi:hypothetical protein